MPLKLLKMIYRRTPIMHLMDYGSVTKVFWDTPATSLPILKFFMNRLFRPAISVSWFFWQNQGVERILLSPPLIYTEMASFQKNSRIPLELLIYKSDLESSRPLIDLYSELKIIKETGMKSLRIDLRDKPIDLFAMQVKKYRQMIDHLYLVQNLFSIEND